MIIELIDKIVKFFLNNKEKQEKACLLSIIPHEKARSAAKYTVNILLEDTKSLSYDNFIWDCNVIGAKLKKQFNLVSQGSSTTSKHIDGKMICNLNIFWTVIPKSKIDIIEIGPFQLSYKNTLYISNKLYLENSLVRHQN